MSKNLPRITDKSSVKELQEHLAQVCILMNWDKNNVEQVFLLMTEEVGELANALRKHTAMKGRAPDDSKENLAEELADVLNYLMEIANRYDIDLYQAYRGKVEKNLKRTWKN